MTVLLQKHNNKFAEEGSYKVEVDAFYVRRTKGRRFGMAASKDVFGVVKEIVKAEGSQSDTGKVKVVEYSNPFDAKNMTKKTEITTDALQNARSVDGETAGFIIHAVQAESKRVLGTGGEGGVKGGGGEKGVKNE